MLRDADWVDAYISAVMQWPKDCTLSTKDRQLVGLAKSLASSWEPGILNHTDLALASGSGAEAVSEVLRATSIVVGLANLDRATQGMTTCVPRKRAALLLKPLREYFGSIPEVFTRELVLEDIEWLRRLLTVTKPAYDSRTEVIDPRLRSLVCLAAASVMGWGDGVRSCSRSAEKFGATKGEVADVVKSVFKTSVSNAMAAGFRTPCHIPRLDRYRTILSAYAAAGALEVKGPEPLEARASSQSRHKSLS